MASLDVRTRRRSQIQSLSEDRITSYILPEMLEAHGIAAARGAAAIGAPPLTITVGERQFMLVVDSGSLRMRGGTNLGSIVVAMDEAALSDLVQDVASLSWLEMMKRLDRQSGSADDLARWDPIFRTLRDGTPVYEKGSISFDSDSQGELDLRQNFDFGSDLDAAGDFLVRTGYLHVRNVFTADEMEAVSAELDTAIVSAERDDGRSWWAQTNQGWYPARILGFNRSSETLRELLKSERFLSLTSLVEDDLIQSDVDDSDMAEGLLKKVGVRQGISDVPWHKDCGPGGHSYGCSGITVGIQVTGADHNTGELGVMAGSNRANVPGLYPVQDFGFERIPLRTAQGDCTIHCGCTMHMSRPPITADRRVVYTGFGLAPFAEDMDLLPSNSEKRQSRAALQDYAPNATGSHMKRTHLSLDR